MNGGIVPRPTLAIIGEAGPEAVVPLTTYGIALGGPYVCRGCGVHHVHTSPCESPLDNLDDIDDN